jgi:hypothetical protein
MFYSRPNIEPLGWNLVDLPTPSGSKTSDGVISDNRPVDFRFSGGWLSVERGEVGAPANTDMEEVLAAAISLFGAHYLLVEHAPDVASNCCR